MSPLDTLESRFSGDRWLSIGRIVAISIAVFLLWAAFARLDEVSIAPGEVVPRGQIKTIQHLEGGIIEEIYVREGDAVRKDAPLVRLDLAGSVSSIGELQVRLDSLLLTRAQLEAEATGSEATFPNEVSARRPQLKSSQQAAFVARNRELQSSLSVLQGQVTQRDRDMRETRARLTAARESLGLAQRRLAMSANLLKDNLQAPMDHLEIERDVSSLKGDVASLREALPRARAALNEARERVSELEFKFQREARELLGETEADIARVQEVMVKATDQQIRTTIRSPHQRCGQEHALQHYRRRRAPGRADHGSRADRGRPRDRSTPKPHRPRFRQRRAESGGKDRHIRFCPLRRSGRRGAVRSAGLHRS